MHNNFLDRQADYVLEALTAPADYCLPSPPRCVAKLIVGSRPSSCGQRQRLRGWSSSYGGKTVPRWRTAAILKIVISPYLSEKSSDFDEILYAAADFELDKRHVNKN